MPLSGLTVVEIGQNIAGPFAGTILADLGADVIKIEKPGGDDARFWLVEKDGERHPLAFHLLNRNKRSAVVDFKDEAALARFLALVERADVLVHNLRPGLAETLGIGQAALEARNPRLVYCEVGAFGRTGPLASKPGYEPLAHAYAGIMAMNGPVEGLPMRAGASIVDPGTGMWAVIGILAALRRRERTGKGGRVDVSLFETGLGWVYQPVSDYLFEESEAHRPQPAYRRQLVGRFAASCQQAPVQGQDAVWPFGDMRSAHGRGDDVVRMRLDRGRAGRASSGRGGGQDRKVCPPRSGRTPVRQACRYRAALAGDFGYRAAEH